ncbi:hypothetical protein [Arthrobacter bambusae]|uniref:Uncharacterized protein n=1 Tax=Arthrobacter bambusae TaxID=1338426 RepID=A0AAW8D2K5_9MICC|nr:hypothetical protein [Arthrobacter bambusae]MDP9903131.1 hypothetical protein [Arthrobacter bambusae]MDQ0128875.1 hypothetical protein [Arthrobacter bambusae]MDQ0180216.1 hypothetical protein [Arthrobacter bambusae]
MTSSPIASPTIAVFSDPRASTLFLQETAQSLVTQYKIERAYVDLSTLAGLTVATAFLEAGIPYESLEFGKAQPAPETDPQKAFLPFEPKQARSLSDAPHLRQMSAGTVTLDVEELTLISANLVVIPAMADETLMDFSQGTVVGQVLNHVEKSGGDLLLIAPPERGLRPIYSATADAGSTEFIAVMPERYERQTVLVRKEPDSGV